MTDRPEAALETGADDDIAAAWHELLSGYHAVVCTLDRELQSRHQLSGTEFEILQQLHRALPVTDVRMHDLAGEVHLTQSALSRAVARLEQDGLVERSMCTDDRRSVFAIITPAGITRYLEARPTQRAVLHEQAGAALDSARRTIELCRPEPA
jgi:DNA-binding MarR family transcriptional regulator